MKLFSPHKIILATVDFVVINFSFLIALWLQYCSGYYYKITQIPYYNIPVFILFSFLLIVIFQTHGLYKYQVFLNVSKQIVQLLKSLVYGSVLFIAVSFLSKSSYITQSRLVIGFTFSIAFLLLVIARCVVARSVYVYLTRKGVQKKILIIGAGEKGKKLFNFIQRSKNPYFEVVGLVDDPSPKSNSINGINGNVPVLGSLDNIRKLVKDNSVDEIMISIDQANHERLLKIIDTCKEAVGVPVHVVSDLYQVVTQKVDVEEFGGMLTVKFQSREPGIVTLGVKRTVDIMGSLLGIVLLLPLFGIMAILIKLSSKGPVFYKYPIVGKNGKEFVFYKFRTMEVGNNEVDHQELTKKLIQGFKPTDKSQYKLQNNLRIIRFGGKFFRKFSLDELPQLFNVLKGDMSLVGPRPNRPYEWKYYKDWHKRRGLVKPGITGLWQATARSDVSFDDMVVLDIYYIENMSFWFDLQILLKTIPTVIFGKGAY